MSTAARPPEGGALPDTPYDAVIVGGGPAGATAATDLAHAGHRVLLIDRAGRPKPCGGAIPPRLIRDFEIPDALLVARATCARMVAPSRREVDIPIENGFVGMVDRGPFDAWLRDRAARAGAHVVDGTFLRIDRGADGAAVVVWSPADGASAGPRQVGAKAVIGADGARSAVARQCLPGGVGRQVFAYHEIVRAPVSARVPATAGRCEVHYRGDLSPDFYGWVFPHGDTISIGSGSADKGFSLRGAVQVLRQEAGYGAAATVRREGAPIPMKPLRRWDNGRDVVVVGDAAGVVAPASGEGIYYAMASGRLAADAVRDLLRTGDRAALRTVRRRFMRSHGMVFRVLGIMQWFWYTSDRRRERFVTICRDRDVQQLTFEAYMNKALVRRRPLAHLRIFCKDMAHLLGWART